MALRAWNIIEGSQRSPVTFWILPSQLKSDDSCTSMSDEAQIVMPTVDACLACLTHAPGHRHGRQGNVKLTHLSEPIALASGDQCEKARPAVHQGMQVAEGGAQLLSFKGFASHLPSCHFPRKVLPTSYFCLTCGLQAHRRGLMLPSRCSSGTSYANQVPSEMLKNKRYLAGLRL